ncbi:hypothetical protein JRC04_23160 [Mycolicibacterium sp. S2-37]|uniref:hypothetical protein n=1 Tax=Mycolicibacterium sp. S2-37 TaxID=2810297 RepID=UPI001A93B66E|nr:hypothetical protein [Mycolicibacterium sp. S2-37]MBO0680376.1 hypothetical protein [Mycolicibacterium sp. S2-37]
MTDQTFPFRFTRPYQLAAAPFGIHPSTAEVVIHDDQLICFFGPWQVASSLDNIIAVAITGPYSFVRTAGSARMSMADRGLTLATNGDRGVCMLFEVPVPGIEPTGRLRHPNLTVTVADCDGLAKALAPR